MFSIYRKLADFYEPDADPTALKRLQTDDRMATVTRKLRRSGASEKGVEDLLVEASRVKRIWKHWEDFRYPRRAKELRIKRQAVVKQALELANALEADKELRSLTPVHFSLMAYTYTIDNKAHFYFLRNFFQIGKLLRGLNKIGKTYPIPTLASYLRGLVRLLERHGKNIDPEEEKIMDAFSRKPTLKEFAKRYIFSLLHEHIKSRQAPNKETAIMVNVLLNLPGDQQVTPNDISQMRKNERRTYYKD